MLVNANRPAFLNTVYQFTSAELIKTKGNIFFTGKTFRYLSKYITTGYMNSVFKALNDPTRREILSLLQEKDMTAGEIVDRFNISFPSISHHLDILKQAKLVISEKEGQYVYYSLNTTVVDEILKWFMQFKSKKK